MKRWPIIRHIRWFFLNAAFWSWWESTGRYLGAMPNESDLNYLDDVWNGEQ